MYIYNKYITARPICNQQNGVTVHYKITLVVNVKIETDGRFKCFHYHEKGPLLEEV